MRHKLIKYCKGIYTIAKANSISWVYSTRTISLFAFVAAFCSVVVHNHLRSMEGMGISLSFGESLFILINNGFSITTMSTLFLLMVSEIPIQTGYQYKLLIRSSRTQWILSQVLYCLWMVMCMLLLTVTCTSVFLSISAKSNNNNWSAIIETSVQQRPIIPTYIHERFSPFSACLFAILPIFFFWLTMVLIILSFSLSKLPQLGLMVYMTMLVSNVIVLVEPIGSAVMPIHYSTLQNITSNAVGMEIETILKVFLFYLLIDVLILIFMMFQVHRADISFRAAK